MRTAATRIRNVVSWPLQPTNTRELPRYMLREDMPNGLVAELVRVER
ncbi:MAG TPA: hypothetical protein VF033_14025 [Steroidobacteraceae bacterium]|jgi:hypothetical protein